MRALINVISSVPPHLALILLVSALVVVLTTTRVFEAEPAKTRRVEMKKQKELRALANRIWIYGQRVHQQFPTGDVVVSESDLAERLRKPQEIVNIALNLLLNEEKVQRAPLGGYWKLNS